MNVLGRKKRMSLELKIKDKHLGEESRIIKFEERKLKAAARKIRVQEFFAGNDEAKKSILEARRRKAEAGFDSLYRHRIDVVRPECRATHLARAFIKGMPARRVELTSKEMPDLRRILAMVNKYHDSTISMDKVRNWYIFNN